MKAVKPGGGVGDRIRETKRRKKQEQAVDTRLSHKHGERASPFPSRHRAPEWDHANVTKQKS